MTKYNTGDRVRVTSVNSPDHAGYLIGKIGTVVGPYLAYPNNFDVEVEVDGIGERLFKNNQVELVERARKFKVGDQVRITGVQPLGNKNLIGRVGTVNGGDLGWYYLNATDENAYRVTVGGEDWYGFFESQLEEIKENKNVESGAYSISINAVSKGNVEDLTNIVEQFIEIMNEVPDSGDLSVTVGDSTISLYRE